MKIYRNSKALIALLLAIVLAIGTPVTILAEEAVTEESTSESESASEAEDALESESAQGSESASASEGEPTGSEISEAVAAEPAAASQDISFTEEPQVEISQSEPPVAVAELEIPAPEDSQSAPQTPEEAQSAPEASEAESEASDHDQEEAEETQSEPEALEPDNETKDQAPVEADTSQEMPLQPETVRPEESQNTLQSENPAPENAQAALKAASLPEGRLPENKQLKLTGASLQTTGAVQGASGSEYAPEIINSDNLTTILKGVPEEKRQKIMGIFSTVIPESIASGKREFAEDPALIDAEKFSTAESGYDRLLCWAATASNMLWVSGHAQHAVNPYTNAVFADVDEVFDYFRRTFTDATGNTDAGLQYFFEGKYLGQGIDGASQLKDVNANKGALSDADPKHGEFSLTTGDEFDPLSIVESIADFTYGLGVSFWNTSTQKKEGSHAITLMGISLDKTQSDFRKRYKGVIVADSDNTTASKAAHTDFSLEEKAKLAAGQPNRFTFYPIVWELIDNVYFWVMKDYAQDGSIAFIDYLYYLEDYREPEPEPEDDKEDEDVKSDSDKNNDNQNTYNILNAYIENYINGPALEVMKEIDINTLKETMILNNLLVFSNSGSTYQKSGNEEYSLFVRRLDTALLNVYFNGKRLSADGTNYQIVRLPNGMFKIILSKQMLDSLDEGSYTLTLEFQGSDDINVVIDVK